MNPIRCIIIEDEFPAIALLKRYLADIPDWEVLETFTNAVAAMSYLSRHPVDVIFLDIQLPKLSGINFIRALENPPLIVITTAYNEHAVEAFELTVFDYLLKPYPFARFLKTIHRINGHFQGNGGEVSPVDYLLVRENRENVKLPISEICYIESQREYASIVCRNRTVKTRMSISKLEEVLRQHGFLRIHRSFLVALDKVDAYSTKQVRIGEETLPIGRYYQKEVRKNF